MGQQVDKVLKLCAGCSKEQLVETVATVCKSIDEAESEGNVALTVMYRDLCRVIDGMGELRFSKWWPSHSPARKRDKAASLELSGNTRLVQ